ncbi:kelch domain-containing protein 1 isoform X1 [Geospiza fortis]|uniref:Kelch domain-containing protein 1 isoform X1 n=1 Tax=Geospiza fortis TaxID=48883 RepID=A0A6I9Z9X7_GEOFO|nr:kelch domain-containing protein 1 isoform X1 [Geospiza fortis]
MDSGLWTMHLMEGELPTSMSGSCGASINGKLYIFGGFDDKGYSNRLYYVNLRTKTGTYRWKKITNFKGQPPTPRDKLSCWVYKNRLIYFGGYGCRKHNELSDCFDVHDAFWEGQIFWGWHNDVHVFDTTTQTWSQPTIRGGDPPQPRAAHTCAVLGNKGYIFGGRVLFTIIQIFPGKRLCKEPERARKCHEASPIHLSGRKGHLFPNLELELVKEDDDDDDDENQLYQESFENRLRSVMWTQFLQQTRMNDLHCLNLDTWTWSGRINISGEKPRDRSWHTLTPIGEDRLFLFGGLSSDNVPLSDGWIHSIATNGWKQLTHLPKSRPRLWHTACLGQEGEVMVFGGSKDDLLFMDTGHCSDLLIFQTQPYSLLRLCLDCIGKNAALLEKQIPCLPPKLVQEVLKKITFWAAMTHRQERKAETERQSQLQCT